MKQHEVPQTQRRTRLAHARRAVSLIELVVAMTGSAVVFGLAVGAVQQSMKLSSHAKAQLEHQQTLARLCQQFRSDIRNASSVTLTSDPLQLKLVDMAARKVTYNVEVSTVLRESDRSNQQGSAREQFRLAAGTQIRLAAMDAEHFQLAVVRSNPEGERLEREVVATMHRLLGLQSLKKEQP